MTTGQAILETRRKEARSVFSAFQIGKIAQTGFEIERAGGVSSFEASDSIMRVYEVYRERSSLDFVPVTESGMIVGYVLRNRLFAALSSSAYSRDLLLRPEVTLARVMDTRVAVIDAQSSLIEASNVLMEREEEVRFDPFVIIHEGRYFGISSVRRLLDGINYYMKMDMQAAEDQQQKLMQSDRTALETGFESDLFVRQLSSPGGDYAAQFDLSEHISLFALFDVCGKGIKASGMVTALGSAIKTAVELDLRHNRGRSYNDLVAALNRIVHDLTPDEMYATGVIFIADRLRNVLHVFDFGHGYLWIVRNQKTHRLAGKETSPGEMTFFGINRDLRLEGAAYRIRPGDIVYTCSDGIVEARNRDREHFGTERLMKILSEMRGVSPRHINSLILAAWKTYLGESRPGDDVSMIAMKYMESRDV